MKLISLYKPESIGFMIEANLQSVKKFLSDVPIQDDLTIVGIDLNV